ncbi:MAG: Ldh family oxidoreductase [Candidatus Caldatribacteriota bacterium]|jgi:LDH2 family malate/lactate/ureidoglycolate dehydrogenase|nr:Ldh family oxidoreductase [Atribacterota bacterium]MDD3641603.1 Ldh family oxidoreductase [Atribacterota bacterium]MDD4765950.1 Ldh family oxidoreductase [Atribacterota bacterium]MDI9596055.1 Ldh family oxidoreductase [Atribacterota bacterium]
MENGITWVDFNTLNNFITDVFKKMGLDNNDAEIASDVLISANKVGMDSHGIDRLKTYYYDKLNSGIVNKETNIEIINNQLTTAVVDGHGGIGLVIGRKSMQLAIEKAKKYGLGMVAVRNSNHYGFAGYYAQMAIDNEMIGITGTNTPPYVAPTFGIENLLGTNPFTFGLPTDEDFPFIIDCATTVTALGKVQLYEKLNKDLPHGWVMDNSGKTMTDAKKAHHDIMNKKASLLPLGGIGEENAGYKGYGYSTVVEILSAALQEGDYLDKIVVKEKDKNSNKSIGHFFIAINIRSFIEVDKFRHIAGNIVRGLRNSKKAPGVERIYTAGEKEHLTWLERKDKGVPVNKKMQEQILIIKEELGLKQYKFPF